MTEFRTSLLGFIKRLVLTPNLYRAEGSLNIAVRVVRCKRGEHSRSQFKMCLTLIAPASAS